MNWKRRVMFVGAAFSALCVIASATDRPTKAAVDSTYQQSFDKWKGELVEDLKQEWLPLAGLFWLKLGDNSFGSDPKNAIVFPKGPSHAGWFILLGKSGTAKFAAGENATTAGQPVTTVHLEHDVSGNPTVVEMGSLRLHVIMRG